MEFLDLDPKALALKAFKSAEIMFSPFDSNTKQHDEYVNELLRLSTEGVTGDE